MNNKLGNPMRLTKKFLQTTLFNTLAFFLLANISIANAATDAKMLASKHIDSIVLGAGCFWGAEKRYAKIPGVIDAVSGYADGVGIKPTYKEITKWKYRNDPRNYAEVVKVTYNSNETDLETILRKYFETHDPTQLDRQGNDIGTQYRSTILTNSNEQITTAKTVLNQFQMRLNARGYGKIVTKVKPLTTFYPAEEYHQDYLKKNPNGYCPDHSTGVTFADKPNEPVVDNASLTKGQQIVVIDSPDCGFCEKFKQDVVSSYDKSTPITFRRASQLKGLQFKTPTWATPTILFLKDGKEISGHQGYMSADKFYGEHKRLMFM